MRNISSLFTRPDDGFISAISLTQMQRDKIQSSKSLIKEALREGITSAIKKSRGITLSPRFMSQGSGVYKTRNQPCYIPPQQIDHDLGCYLPLSFHIETGKPDIASQVFFEIVDKILEILVQSNGWDGIDTTKKTCSRVIIDSAIHIDIPLYSIPDNEFHTVTEMYNASMESVRKSITDSLDWEDIDSQKVLLAHRIEDWKPSDPRKLNRYFTRIFNIKGEQLRRICRYLKAWRDFVWEEGGPSSIFLMLIADSLFNMEIPERDDLALLDILKGISFLKNGSIKSPVDEEIITITDNDFERLKNMASSFSSDLNKAITSSSTNKEACELIRNHLGNRFPIDPNIPLDSEYIRKIVVTTPIQATQDRRPNDRGRAG